MIQRCSFVEQLLFANFAILHNIVPKSLHYFILVQSSESYKDLMTVIMVMSASSSSSRPCCQNGVTVVFIFCFLMFPSNSDGSLWNMSGGVVGLNKEMKMRVGSRPPRCVNKCLICRPCLATLVISQHHSQQNEGDDHYKAKSREESYYLLSWKCKCGDKLFQP